MSFYLIVQYPYNSVQIALCSKGIIIEQKTVHKYDAVSLTIPTIQELLYAQGISLQDLAFLGVNVGPGPYNTLRSILTMINGISNVTGIPIVAVSALDALFLETNERNTSIILQAFQGHIFYAIKTDSSIIKTSSTIEDYLHAIEQQATEITVHGNAVEIYRKDLTKIKNIVIPEKIIPFNSLETLAALTFQKASTKDFVTQAMPVYYDHNR